MRIAYKRESKSLICVFELRGFIRGFTRAGRLLMGLCRRQIIRLRKKYTTQGEMGLIHGNRDRRPQHRIGEWIRHDVLRLYREKYHDFNFSHFTDCLKEAEGIDISRSSVVRILTAEGFKSKKNVKRRAKLHRARPRKTC